MTKPVDSPFLAVTAPIPDHRTCMPDLQDALAAGVILKDRYRIGRVLARGSTAVVYEATQIDLVRRVAIKLIKPECAANVGCARRFEREARFVASVQHPHVVAVHELGRTSDGGMFIAMELVQGCSLREQLAKTASLPWREAARIAAQIAEALEAVHQCGIVHGDVSAANVLLTRGGQQCHAKLIDFGAARHHGESALRLATLATPPYAAPELHRGHTPSARSDVYALGVLLNQMLGPLPLSRAPTTLQDLIACAVDCEPACRPGSAGEFAALLNEMLGQRQVSAFAWPARAAAVLALVVLGVGALGYERLGGSPVRIAGPVPEIVASAAATRTAMPGSVAKVPTPRPTPQLSPDTSLANAQLTAALDRWISEHNSREAKQQRLPVMAMRVGKPTIAFDPTGTTASLTYRKRFSYAAPGYSSHSIVRERLLWSKVDGEWKLIDGPADQRS